MVGKSINLMKEGYVQKTKGIKVSGITRNKKVRLSD